MIEIVDQWDNFIFTLNLFSLLSIPGYCFFGSAVVIPEKLAFKHVMQYPTLPCEPAALQLAYDKLTDRVNRLPCIVSKTCYLGNQTVHGCEEGDGRNRRDTTQAVTAEVDLYTYEENKDSVNLTHVLQNGEALCF